jgi:hypothetical protein
MTKTSAIAASLWLAALPLAASAAAARAPRVVEAEEDDLRDDAPVRPELTVSGTAQTQAFLQVPGITLTAVNGAEVFELSAGWRPHDGDGISDLATSLLAGWNCRLLGAERQGGDLDLRLLAGPTFAIETGGWLNLPLFGIAAAAEVAGTAWLSPDVAVSVAAQGGLNMVLLAFPTPMARLTAGLTF